MSKAIKQMYRSKGLKAPDGKGIHTAKFHRCVVANMIKLKQGDLPAGSSPHAICMATLGKEKAVHKSHRRPEGETSRKKYTKLLKGRA